MRFQTTLPIRFAHCDPAGIVFYPRYFEMMNGVVEDWCAQSLGWSFHEMHLVRGIGLPTVHIETDFIKPSQLGETLHASLQVQKIGGASVHLELQFCGADDDLRVKAQLVLVTMDLQKYRAIAIPEELKQRMQPYCCA